MNPDIYYRPEWTCGKYNAEKHVAIIFNLIADGDFLFENDSADVVGFILKAGRNGAVSVSQISLTLGISSESLFVFFDSLVELGLLSKECISPEVIMTYRKQCVSQPQGTRFIGENVEYYNHCNISSVAEAYAKAVSDCTGISSVLFELTYRCSEKCLHCYNPGAVRNDNEKSGRNLIKELSLDDYKRIIDEMCAAGLVFATLSGGDPFANDDAWNIIEYLYSKDIAVTILTNGQQLSNHIERLANLYPRSVRLSLYSSDPLIHDSITRKIGSWQKTMNVIRDLREKSIPTVVNCMIMRPGVKSYAGLKKICSQLSCQITFDINIIDSLDGDMCATNHLRLTPEEMECVMLDQDVEPNVMNADLSSNPAPSKGLPCFAGRGTFCVTPDGKLIPCVAMHMVLGDLKNHSFSSILKDNPRLKMLLTAAESDYEECGTHEYCKCCVFCAGNSFAEHNTPFCANENNCYVAKIRYSLMQKLKSQSDNLKGKTMEQCVESLPDYNFSILHREYKRKG